MRQIETLDFIKRQFDIEFINLLGHDRIELKFNGDFLIFDYFFDSKTDLKKLNKRIKSDYFDYISVRKPT